MSVPVSSYKPDFGQFLIVFCFICSELLMLFLVGKIADYYWQYCSYLLVIFHIFDNSIIFGIIKNITSNELEEKKKKHLNQTFLIP